MVVSDPSGRRSLNGPDRVGTHHLVVLVFQDVAVPHELPVAIEGGLYPRDSPGCEMTVSLVPRSQASGGRTTPSASRPTTSNCTM